MHRFRYLVVLATIAGAILTTGPVAQACCPYKPDAILRLSTDPTIIGDDIYNADASGQTLSEKVGQGKHVTFALVAQNDGTLNDSFAWRGCDGRRGLVVKYFSGSTDVTSQVKSAGGFTGPSVNGGGLMIVDWFVRVSVKNSATRGVSLTCKNSITSVGDANVSDTAAIKVKVGG